MQVIKVVPSGFCIGVIKAINLVKDIRDKYPNTNIYLLGHLVHNHYISDYFSTYNIITLDDTYKSKEELIDQIDSGIVIFSAHGIADSIKEKAINKGLIVFDATCPYVLKTKEIIIDYLNKDYEIFYIGKNKHPEAMAILSISEHIHLIENINDIPSINYSKIFVTNQTTMSIKEIKEIFDQIKDIYPHAIITDEICDATRRRQSAIEDIKEADLLYVVGDIKSNNSNKLKSIAQKANIKKVRLISSALDIDINDLKDVSLVYVTSGASTPNYLRDQVIETLKIYSETKILTKPSIDLNKLL